MGQNQEDFVLHFTQELPVAKELLIKGGDKDPLDDMVTTVSAKQYKGIAARTVTSVPPLFDFRVFGTVGDEKIMRDISPGLKLTSDFDRLTLPDKEYPQRVWKLQRKTSGRMLKYPEEVQIIVQDAFKGQYVIKPKEQSVRLETFKQMLRCLPWVKT